MSRHGMRLVIGGRIVLDENAPDSVGTLAPIELPRTAMRLERRIAVIFITLGGCSSVHCESMHCESNPHVQLHQCHRGRADNWKINSAYSVRSRCSFWAVDGIIIAASANSKCEASVWP